MNIERLWRMIDRQKLAYRKRLAPVFVKAFDAQIQPFYDKIMQTSDIRDVEVPPLDNTAIEQAYEKLYMTTAIDFAKSKRAGLRKFIALKDDDDLIVEDLIMEHIKSYLKQNAGTTIVAIGDTSRELLQDLLKQITPEILDAGIGAGAAQTMLRDRIQSAWHEAKRYRTERIVRTEVNRAANWGSLEGIKSVGVDMNKVWLSAFAKESRPEHMAANGQKVGLYETFSVGGENLQYPGDPAGSAANTINCLCSLYEQIR